MNGVLIVDKPAGLTSAEVVRRIKSRARAKVGHLGTLDPFATGILPLCLGEATKIAQFLSGADKTYVGEIRLGAATDTGDCTGSIVRTAPIPELKPAALVRITEEFTGDCLQVPPMYSALKRAGVPLYKLARKGMEVERQARQVRIVELRLEPTGVDRLRFEVECSKGTYVRVLAEDIGRALQTEGYVSALRRTRFGPFGLEKAVDLQSWNPTEGASLVSILDALSDLPVRSVAERVAAAARQGKTWVLGEIEPAPDGSIALLVAPH